MPGEVLYLGYAFDRFGHAVVDEDTRTILENGRVIGGKDRTASKEICAVDHEYGHYCCRQRTELIRKDFISRSKPRLEAPNSPFTKGWEGDQSIVSTVHQLQPSNLVISFHAREGNRQLTVRSQSNALKDCIA